MSIYTVEIDGKQYDIEGDRPPTEQEARQAVGEFSNQNEGQQVQPEQGMEAPVDKRKQAEYRTSAQAANILNTMLMGVPQAIAQKGFGQDFVNKADLKPGDELLGQLIGSIVPGEILAKGIGMAAKATGLSKIMKFDNSLRQAEKGKEALDTVRTTLGKAKQLAIQEVADVPTELSFGNNMSEKVIKAIQNPIYGVEFNEVGGIKQTVGNLDKIKEAVGELIHTPKIWEEAPTKELRMVKQFYGNVTSAMRSAAKNSGKPIDDVLDNYHKFMENYNLVNKTLVDSAGQAYGNKLKAAFKFGAEPAYKEAWKEVSKISPEVKSVMNSMNNRELLANLLKGSVATAAVGGGGKYLLDKLTSR